MITCPLCEHQQPSGFECEVCGKELGGLSALGPPPAREERLEGLEPNAAAPQGEVPVDRLEGLEPSRFEAVVPAPGEAVEGLELDREAPIGEVPLEVFDDLTPDRAPDDGQRTVLATDAVTCRYCRQVQAPAASCARCGMSLPRLQPSEEGVILGTVEEVAARCRACGAPGRAGQRCGDCGTLVPFP
jgi:hypothetical protein